MERKFIVPPAGLRRLLVNLEPIRNEMTHCLVRPITWESRAVTLAGAARALILGYIAKGWIIIAHRKQEGTGAPLKGGTQWRYPIGSELLKLCVYEESVRCHADSR